MAILPEIPQPSFIKISLKITYMKFHSNLPGTNELYVTQRIEWVFAGNMQLWYFPEDIIEDEVNTGLQ